MTPLEQRLFHALDVPGFAARAGNHHSDAHEIMPATLALVVLGEERFSATSIDSAATDLAHNVKPRVSVNRASRGIYFLAFISINIIIKLTIF